MDYKLRTFQITHEATFLAPQFGILGIGATTKLLDELYTHINPRFPINMKDMQVHACTKLDDVRVRLELFSGNGVIEISASKFGAIFKNAVSGQDLNIIKDCIQSSLTALFTTVPAARFKEDTIHANLILDLQGKQNNASGFLRGVIANQYNVNASQVGATVSHYGVHVEFENAEQKWLLTVDVQRSWGEQQALFIASHAYFYETSAVPIFEDKINLLYNAITHVNENIGLTPSKTA